MAILIEEEYWRNSYFSIARFYGGIVLNSEGKQHIMKIVNKNGITLKELSDPGSKHYVKDGMAIPPGEPADMIDVDFLPYYKKLGRDKFIAILKDNQQTPREMLKRIYEDEVAKSRR